MLERYYRELLNFVSRSVGDRERAADVVQEAFANVLAAQAAAGALPGGGAVREPRALLYRTAKNLLIDQHRRAQVRDHVELDHPDTPEPAAAAHAQPEVRLAARQTAQRLLGAIETLPPRCREAFVLFKFEGLPQAEIAARMGISRNMVEKHVISGMLACRRSLEGAE